MLARCRHLLAVLVVSATAPLHASRTGLNNVPIADVSAPGTGVVQAYSAFGEDRKPSWLTGPRIGFTVWGERFEAGFDSRWRPSRAVPVFFNAKWVSRWDKSLPALGVGVASLAPTRPLRDRLGQPQSYAVVSHTTRFARLHAGYALQTRNDAWFFGLDRSWQVAGRKLTFRGDLLQIQNRTQWLASAGFTYRLSDAISLELWQSNPTEHGRSYTTAKVGWNFRFGGAATSR